MKSLFSGNLLHLAATMVVVVGAANSSAWGEQPGEVLPGKDADIARVLYLKTQAQKGDTAAQVTLGDFFSSRQQFTEAVFWYRYAATNGEVTAQLALAAHLVSGRGAVENRKEAAHWMRLAADGVENPRPAMSPSTSSRGASLIITRSNATASVTGVSLGGSKNLFTNALSHSTHESRRDNLAATEPSSQGESVPSAGSK